MTRPTLSLIAAVARNGAIGRRNALLVHLSDDLKRFKRVTLGSPIVMGRKTWESIGRPLPGRRNIVVTRNAAWRADGAEPAASLQAALELAAPAPKLFVIGGAELYTVALPLADELVLTELDADFDADAWFPAWDRAAFTASDAEHHVSAEGLPYRFVTYTRRRAGG
jgi:dihydrofolate reductase